MKNKFNNEVEFLGGVAYTAKPKIPKNYVPINPIGYQNNLHTSRIGILIIVAMAIIGSIWMVNIKNDINSQIDTKSVNLTPKQEKSRGMVSVYNLVAWQTDSDFCTGAYGDNICQLLEQGVPIVANNCLPKNTEVEIEGLGRFVVMDRMNSRYSCEYFDIAMESDKVIEAIQFGRVEKEIIIYE